MKLDFSVASLMYAWVWVRAVVANTLAWLRRGVYGLALPFFSPRPFLPGDTSVSAAWIEKILRADGILPLDIGVATAVLEDLKGNRGLASTMNRVRVTYTGPLAPLPTALILKTVTVKDFLARMRAVFSGSCREARLYREFRRELGEHLPRVFYARESFLFGDMVIVSEDLSQVSTGVNFYFGNQIWGMQPLAKPIAPEIVLRALFGAAAQVHARFWRDPRLLQNSWMKSASWYEGRDRASWELAVKSMRACWTRVSAGFSAAPEPAPESASASAPGLGGATSNGPLARLVAKDGSRWEPQLVELITTALKHTSWETFQHHLRRPDVPFTLTHNDFHASNMLLRHTLGSESDESEAALAARLVWVDWSEVGPWEPTADLGQFFISDVAVPVRRAHERALIEHYWTALTRRGVSPESYPLETCWEQYRRATLERWIVLLILLSAFGLPGSAVQYFHDQVWAFACDHAVAPAYPLKHVLRFFM
jgi:hypothetical protein